MRKHKRELIPCACGICDNLILSYDKYGKSRKYKKGHNGKINPVTETRPVKERTSRERAMKILTQILKKTECDVKNELCNGKLQTHHIDKNPFNNNPENLLLLCDTHHNFADNRNLRLDELKNLKLSFYVSSDKRRYCGVKL